MKRKYAEFVLENAKLCGSMQENADPWFSRANKKISGRFCHRLGKLAGNYAKIAENAKMRENDVRKYAESGG